MESVLDPYTLRIAGALMCFGAVFLWLYIVHVVLKP